MITVFFGCSMRGGYRYPSIEELIKIRDLIEELGCKLISKHQTQIDWQSHEKKLTKRQIHDRNYEWIGSSDAGVFEISTPSLGVGGEISDMINRGKPVLGLFKDGLQDQVSAYILGKQGSQYCQGTFQALPYKNLSETKKIIKKFLMKVK